jgi:hypothetical protein
MTTRREYGQTQADLDKLPAEADKPVYKTGEGDPVNRPAAEARWGVENVGGVWLLAIGLGALFVAVLILFLVIGLFL